jgi:glucose/arabinose dehydrogenase
MPVARRVLRRLGLALVLAGLIVPLTATSSNAAGLGLELVDSGFTLPVFVTHAGDSRLFVVEQGGLIKIIHDDASVTTFLDISGMLICCGEQGLLGLAFHPGYATNGLFYVNFTRASDAADVIYEFKRSNADPDQADPNSGRLVLAIPDPYSNHNGGWMAFRGQYLYASFGDGGSGGDPENRAQNLKSLLGKILRINPLDPDGSGPRTYSIPAGNPFVGRSGRDEIWSYGLRNPWRCSFDRGTGKLWCGDVGQNLYEEVDRVRTGRGVNFGWRLIEGRHYYNYPHHTSGDLCTGKCRKLPIAEYAHSAFGGGNCAVIGGYVSRRSGAALFGQYVFGDECSGRAWLIPATFAPTDALPTPIETGYSISSFGEGSDGRLYLVDLNGAIYRLTDS